MTHFDWFNLFPFLGLIGFKSDYSFTWPTWNPFPLTGIGEICDFISIFVIENGSYIKFKQIWTPFTIWKKRKVKMTHFQLKYTVVRHKPKIFTDSALWAGSVIESQCLYVCMSPPSDIYFEASHWPWDHMISFQASHWPSVRPPWTPLPPWGGVPD